MLGYYIHFYFEHYTFFNKILLKRNTPTAKQILMAIEHLGT